MEVRHAHAGLSSEELLVEPSIEGTGILRPQRANVVLGDQRATRRELSVKRVGLLEDTWLFDALAEAPMQLGAAEEAGA